MSENQPTPTEPPSFSLTLSPKSPPSPPSKFRIALCLHGLSGGTNSKGRIIRAKDGHKTMKRWILDRYPDQIDTFLHSWTPSSEAEMVKLYQPKQHLFEPLKNWDKALKKCSYKFNAQYYKNLHSLYYSYYTVNQMKSDYEKQHDFQYDCVIHARFDLNILGFPQDITQDLDLTKIHFIGWVNKKLLDHIWISNSPTMNRFIEIYPQIHDYDNQLKKIGSNNQYLNHDILSIHLKTIGLWDTKQQLSPQFRGGTFPQRKQAKLKLKPE